MLSLEELKTLEESESGGFVWELLTWPTWDQPPEDSKRCSLRGATGAHAFGSVSVNKKFLPQGARRKCTKTQVFAAPWTIQSMEFSRPEYWSGLQLLSPGDLPKPGIEPRSPSLQANCLPAESPGKPKNTGVGSLPLLQGIFPTQKLNRGLLHCRRILYQLSYQGSPGLY